MTSFRGGGGWPAGKKGLSPGGRPTAPACHPIKK
jgi:hypothetical protein